MTTQETTAQKAKRQRSPAYPAIDLETAIAKAKELWQKEHDASAAPEVILNHWGYSKGSSNGLVVLSALLKFGLLTDEGAGDKRKAKVTDLARKIILDDRPNSTDRNSAIKEAALGPAIYKTLWDKYKGSLPSDDNLRYELRAERAFNDTAIPGFIKDLRSTWAFAKLGEYDTMSGATSDKTQEGEQMTPAVELKTKSDVESGGQSQGQGQAQGQPKTVNSSVVSTVKYSWPLSRSVSADVTITGPTVGANELEMLRKYLDLAKDALKDGNEVK